MGLFYKRSFHIYIQEKIKHCRHHHSFLLLHSNKIYLQLYTHISHYNWNKVLWTMSSPSSRPSAYTSFLGWFLLFFQSFLHFCLLANQRYVSICMFQRVISQNMFYNWSMFMYIQKSRNTHTSTSSLLCSKGFFFLLFTPIRLCFFLYEGDKLS